MGIFFFWKNCRYHRSLDYSCKDFIMSQFFYSRLKNVGAFTYYESIICSLEQSKLYIDIITIVAFKGYSFSKRFFFSIVHLMFLFFLLSSRYSVKFLGSYFFPHSQEFITGFLNFHTIDTVDQIILSWEELSWAF